MEIGKAMKRELKIVIRPNGAVEFDVQGMQGSSCKDFTADLESALGSVQDRSLKESYYQDAELSEEVRRND